MVIYILGKMMGVEALLLLLPAGISLIYKEWDGSFFLIPASICLILFALFGRKAPADKVIYGREGMLIVAGAWILWSLFGALPFTMSGTIPSYINAFFETVSGFTTTGSTILVDIESLPKCMAFWRSFTHWIGGMGVLVFVMVLANLDKKSSMHLLRAEVPGPEKDKLVPKMRQTARILYGIYLGLTALEVIFLLIGGMNVFDAVLHSFSTAGTGGFSNYNASIAHFNSSYIEWTITIFMTLFGINFNMYFLLLLRNFKPVWKNEELRAYLGIIVAAVAIISFNIYTIYGQDSLRTAAFQVTSVMTTTGFISADYTTWPMLSQCILLFLMVVGACASSTGGGIKVTRFLVLLKSIRQYCRHLIHPKQVSLIQVSKRTMSSQVLYGVHAYFMSYVAIFIASVILVSVDNMDFASTLGAVLTCMNNVGPGLGVVGPSGNFSSLSVLSKIVLSFDMLAGRLEIFPFLLFFNLNAWRKKF
jgi:trk system potassium uptake protein TrkH